MGGKEKFYQFQIVLFWCIYSKKLFKFLNNSLRNVVVLVVQDNANEKKKGTLETIKILNMELLIVLKCCSVWITSGVTRFVLTESHIPFAIVKTSWRRLSVLWMVVNCRLVWMWQRDVRLLPKNLSLQEEIRISFPSKMSLPLKSINEELTSVCK